MSERQSTLLVIVACVVVVLTFFGVQKLVLARGPETIAPTKKVVNGPIPHCARARITRPLISLTFDDGYASFYEYGLPLLLKYGFASTDYIISGYTDENPTYVTSPEVMALHEAGQEIASHTVSHPILPALPPGQLDTELKDSQAYLQGILGVPVLDFASPYGEYNQAVIDDAKHYYRSHRSVERGYNSNANFNVYDIRSEGLLETSTLKQVKSWVDYTKKHNVWLVLAYHSVTPTPAPGKSTYNSYPANLEAHLKYIKQSGVTVETVGQVLNQICVR